MATRNQSHMVTSYYCLEHFIAFTISGPCKAIVQSTIIPLHEYRVWVHDTSQEQYPKQDLLQNILLIGTITCCQLCILGEGLHLVHVEVMSHCPCQCHAAKVKAVTIIAEQRISLKCLQKLTDQMTIAYIMPSTIFITR